MKYWIKALRLRTLPLALSCIITGSACAYLVGGFQWNVFLMAILTTIFLQILSNLANDYGDGIKGTDAHRKGPDRMIGGGFISVEAMKKAIFLFVLLSFGCGIYLIYLSGMSMKQSVVFIGLGLLCIAAAIFYTIGKIPYGYRAMGDIAVIIFFGIVGVSGVFYLFIHQLNFAILLPSATIGLLSAAVLHLNNMRDSSEDLLVGKITLANKFGMHGSKQYYYCLIIAAISAISFLSRHIFQITYFVFQSQSLKFCNNPNFRIPQCKCCTFLKSIH